MTMQWGPPQYKAINAYATSTIGHTSLLQSATLTGNKIRAETKYIGLECALEMPSIESTGNLAFNLHIVNSISGATGSDSVSGIARAASYAGMLERNLCASMDQPPLSSKFDGEALMLTIGYQPEFEGVESTMRLIDRIQRFDSDTHLLWYDAHFPVLFPKKEE